MDKINAAYRLALVIGAIESAKAERNNTKSESKISDYNDTIRLYRKELERDIFPAIGFSDYQICDILNRVDN